MFLPYSGFSWQKSFLCVAWFLLIQLIFGCLNQFCYYWISSVLYLTSVFIFEYFSSFHAVKTVILGIESQGDLHTKIFSLLLSCCQKGDNQSYMPSESMHIFSLTKELTSLICKIKHYTKMHFTARQFRHVSMSTNSSLFGKFCNTVCTSIKPPLNPIFNLVS